MDDFLYVFSIGILCILLSVFIFKFNKGKIKFIEKREMTTAEKKKWVVIGYLLGMIIMLGGIATIIISFFFL